MANNIGTFDLRQLACSIGIISVDGYAAGDSVIVSEENDVFNTEAGADGHVDRVKNGANWLNIKIRLQQTSPVNQLFSAQHNLDRKTGRGIVPFLLEDGSGNTLIAAENCWFNGHPKDISFGNEAKVREWTLKTDAEYIINLAGNA